MTARWLPPTERERRQLERAASAPRIFPNRFQPGHVSPHHNPPGRLPTWLRVAELLDGGEWWTLPAISRRLPDVSPNTMRPCVTAYMRRHGHIEVAPHPEPGELVKYRNRGRYGGHYWVLFNSGPKQVYRLTDAGRDAAKRRLAHVKNLWAKSLSGEHSEAAENSTERAAENSRCSEIRESATAKTEAERTRALRERAARAFGLRSVPDGG